MTSGDDADFEWSTCMSELEVPVPPAATVYDWPTDEVEEEEVVARPRDRGRPPPSPPPPSSREALLSATVDVLGERVAQLRRELELRDCGEGSPERTERRRETDELREEVGAMRERLGKRDEEIAELRRQLDARVAELASVRDREQRGVETARKALEAQSSAFGETMGRLRAGTETVSILAGRMGLLCSRLRLFGEALSVAKLQEKQQRQQQKQQAVQRPQLRRDEVAPGSDSEPLSQVDLETSLAPSQNELSGGNCTNQTNSRSTSGCVLAASPVAADRRPPPRTTLVRQPILARSVLARASFYPPHAPQHPRPQPLRQGQQPLRQVQQPAGRPVTGAPLNVRNPPTSPPDLVTNLRELADLTSRMLREDDDDHGNFS